MKRFFKSFGSGSLINSKFRYLKGLKYISIGKNTVLEGNIELTAYDSYRNQKIFQPSIIIGDNCHIGMNAKITTIQKYTSSAEGVIPASSSAGPETLLAAIEIPIPVPHTTIP